MHDATGYDFGLPRTSARDELEVTAAIGDRSSLGIREFHDTAPLLV
jgi:hypothetical protein